MKRKTSAALAALLVVVVSAAYTYMYAVDLKAALKNITSADTGKKLSAIRELAVIHTPESENALINKVKNEKDARTKIQIIEALSVQRSTTAVEALISMLNDANPYVRQAAVIELGYFGNDEHVTAAIDRALRSEKDDTVKSSAVNSLTQHKNKTGVAALGKVINREKDVKAKTAAVRALGKIDTEDAKAELKKHQSDADVGKEVKKALKKQGQ